MPAQTGPEPASLFKAINYTEFQEYVANTANAGYSKNLKIPSELAVIDPSWSTCTPGMYGSWDPPRVLTPAQRMVAPTAAQPATASLATAAPAAGIDPTHLPAASTASPKDSSNGPLKSDPPSASADPSSNSSPKSEEDSDPAWSAGQADNASKDGDAGENLIAASQQGQASGPVKQQDGSQTTMPSQISPGASSLATSGSGGADIGNDAGDSSSRIDPQGLQNSPKDSLWATGPPSLPNSVIFASPTPLIVDDKTIQKATNGGAVIGTLTYTAGYEGSLSDMPISVGVDSIVIGTTTHALPTSTPVLVGGKSVVKAANGDVVIGTSTYPPRSQAQVYDKAISVGVDSVVLGGTSYAIPPPATTDTILVDKNPISRGSDGGAIVQGETIAVGSQTSINGHIISVGASAVVLNSTSYALPNSAGAIVQSSHPQPSSPVTLVNGAVLTAGGNAATISGTTYAIPSDDSGLVVNGQTLSFPTKSTVQSVFTIAGQTFTAAPTGFTINGQSITLGGTAATINGTLVSLGPSGVQIGSKTMPLTTVQTSGGGLGGLIMSGFGSGGEPGETAAGKNGSSVLTFTGDGSRVGGGLGIVLLEGIIMVAGILALLL